MRRIVVFRSLLFWPSLDRCTAIAQPTYQPATGRTLLRAGHVLDVHTGKETPDETMIITGDKIVGIAATSATPAGPGDRVVDLTAYTLLPGLIDVHTHLTDATNFDPYFELTMTPPKKRSSAWKTRRPRSTPDSQRCAMSARTASPTSPCATRSMRDTSRGRTCRSPVRRWDYGRPHG